MGKAAAPDSRLKTLREKKKTSVQMEGETKEQHRCVHVYSVKLCVHVIIKLPLQASTTSLVRSFTLTHVVQLHSQFNVFPLVPFLPLCT